MDLHQIFRDGRSTAADEQFFDSSMDVAMTTNFVDLIDIIELLPHS